MKTPSKINLTSIRFIGLLLWMIAFTAIKTSAQQVFVAGPESTLFIEGTSTLHDWTSKAEAIQGEGRFLVNENAIKDITSLKITIAVKSIKSGKGSMMDKNTYKALQAEQYPEIKYELQTVKTLPGFTLHTTGKLTVAGVSRTVTMKVAYQIQAASKITITGELPILMRDYNIDPPVAMMGTIKTGEEVKVKFSAVFTPSTELSSLPK